MQTHHRRLPWVRELVRQKRQGAGAPRVSRAEAPADAFDSLRTDLSRGFVDAIGTFNQEVGQEALHLSLLPDGCLILAKHAHPAGYLEVVPDRAGLRFIVTVKRRKDAITPIVEQSFESGCAMRDGEARPVWFGAELSAEELVQRILTPFFDEI